MEIKFISKVISILQQMVTTYGMSEIGPWTLIDPSVQSSDVVLRMLARNSMSEKLAEDIDNSVRHIIETAYEVAKNHIKNNRDAIDKLVDVLLENETLSGDEFKSILSEFIDISSIKIDRTSIREMIEA
ncbi:putative peptidase M41 [Medicago truncatula]|uniref:Peptidase M41 n=1 Tax=Medicago truncatula TaxID=3880 RepID=A2Q1U2_MEDTR|nr:Peptidase M41 [Medicago truncatula]RHN44256.1 putative peptidase M41 [Medicago truncatula]